MQKRRPHSAKPHPRILPQRGISLKMQKIRFAACLLAGVLTAGTLGTGAPLIGQAAPAENRNENIEEMSAGTIEESDDISASAAASDAVTITAPDGTVRNARFTTAAEMKQKLGSGSAADWSPRYTTTVESIFWNFAVASQYGSTALTINLAVNAYRNLDMLLDCGYTLDYSELAAYTESYRQSCRHQNTKQPDNDKRHNYIDRYHTFTLS